MADKRVLRFRLSWWLSVIACVLLVILGSRDPLTSRLLDGSFGDKPSPGSIRSCGASGLKLQRYGFRTQALAAKLAADP